MKKIVGVVGGKVVSRTVGDDAFEKIIGNSEFRKRAGGRLNSFIIRKELEMGQKRNYIPLSALRKHIANNL